MQKFWDDEGARERNEIAASEADSEFLRGNKCVPKSPVWRALLASQSSALIYLSRIFWFQRSEVLHLPSPATVHTSMKASYSKRYVSLGLVTHQQGRMNRKDDPGYCLVAASPIAPGCGPREVR